MEVQNQICIKLSDMPNGKCEKNTRVYANGRWYLFSNMDANGNCCFNMMNVGVGRGRKKPLPPTKESHLEYYA